MKNHQRDTNSIIKQAVIIFIGFGLPFYLFFHILTGERSWASLDRKTNILNQKIDYLSQLEENNKITEKKLILLQDKKIDQDLLEELARKNLGLIYQNEIRIKE